MIAMRPGEKVMLMEEEDVEELVTRPGCTLSTLKTERPWRLEEAELCYLQRVEDKAKTNLLTSDLKVKEQIKRKTLYNNWVGEQDTDSEPVKETPHPDSSVYALFAAKPGPKPEEKEAIKHSSRSVQWLQERLKPDYWVEKYQRRRERIHESRVLEAEEQHAKWSAFKASCGGQLSQQYDCYTEGFTKATKARNNILNSLF